MAEALLNHLVRRVQLVTLRQLHRLHCLSGRGKDELFGEGLHLLPDLSGLGVLHFDLSSARVASSRTRHDFNVGILALAFFDGLHDFLDVPEPVALCHFHLLPLRKELVFDEVAVSHLLPTDGLASQRLDERLEVSVGDWVFDEAVGQSLVGFIQSVNLLLLPTTIFSKGFSQAFPCYSFI